jgi:hypothetical protein
LAALAAGGLLWDGITNAPKSYHGIGVGFTGFYQAGFALWVAGAMVAYAIVWHESAAGTILALACVTLGFAIGLTSLYIRYDLQNVIVVANPVEQMFAWASASAPELNSEPQILSHQLLVRLAHGVLKSFAVHSFIFSTSPRPTLLLEWFAIAGAVVAWRRGDRRLPLLVGTLVAIVWAEDTFFTLRRLKLEYFNFTDPLLIIAAALVLRRFPELMIRRRAQAATIAWLVVSLVWANLEPVKHTLSRRQPQEDCYFYPYYLSRVEFPYCPHCETRP